MESLFDILKSRPLEVKVGKQPSERDLVIGELYNRMIECDKKHPSKKKYKPWTIQYFAVKMSKHSLKQLYFLKSTCNDYEKRGGNYGKCLLGSIKVKVIEK